MSTEPTSPLSRRTFIQYAGGGLAAMVAARPLGAALSKTDPNQVTLPPLTAATEAAEKPEPAALPKEERVGFAVVGLANCP